MLIDGANGKESLGGRGGEVGGWGDGESLEAFLSFLLPAPRQGPGTFAQL